MIANSSSGNDSSPTVGDLWYEKVLRRQQLATDSHTGAPITKKHSEEWQKSTNTTHPKLYHTHYSKPMALNHNV